MRVPRSPKKVQPRLAGNGAKMLTTAVEARFAEAQSRLGPHRQQLIRAIVDHCEETCFLSSRDLAKRYKVDAATVVRTVLRSNLSRERVVELAKLIHRSRRIVVVGADFAASLAYYFAYGLVTLGFDAEAPVGTEGSLLHKLKLLSSKDLLIAISFGQCLGSRSKLRCALASKA